ncbi:hypothetical protein [Labilibaculum euxinus]
MKKLFLIILLTSSLSSLSVAQKEAQFLNSNLNLYSPALIDFYNNVITVKISEGTSSANFEGSPYWDETFYKGSIISKDSLLYTGLHLRYNNYKDLMEFKKGENAYEISYQFPLLQIMFDGKIYKSFEYKDGNQDRIGYFQELHNGNYSLYCKNRIYFLEAKPAKGYKAATLPKFKRSAPVYYIKANNELTLINNKKDLLKIFKNEKNKLNSFIKKNKIKLKDQSDMVSLIIFCNNLNK